MKTLRIVKYDEIGEQEYNQYMDEWESNSEKIIPMLSSRNGRPFQEMINKWKTDETDAAFQRGFVPSTLFFLIDDNDAVIGSLSYRHTLNERLLLNGGSIGYGIKPTERRMGYGAKFLIAFLNSDLIGNTRRFLLTCDEVNEGSRKVIEAAGGILQDQLQFEGTWTRRYWIEVKRRSEENKAKEPRLDV